MAKRTTEYIKHRDEVLERYNHRCASCGSTDDLEIHHIVPIAVGGSNNLFNLAALCHSCHMAAHNGRNMTKYKAKVGTQRGGRSIKISFEEFDKAFEKYITGCIGKAQFCKMVGYSMNISRKNNQHYARSMDERGIVRFRNNVDTAGVNGHELKDGVIVGYVEYTDGRCEDMYFHDTGENKVEYTKRAEPTNRRPGHYDLSKKPTCRVRVMVDGQTFDDAFRKYTTGEIGNSEFSKLIGYPGKATNDNCSQLRSAMKVRKIYEIRNFVDDGDLHIGDVACAIEYYDGRVERYSYKGA